MIYALYHSPGETVGLLGDVLRQIDLPFNELHLYKGDALPKINDVQGLIVMGGPMNVDEVEKYPYLRDEAALIGKVIAEKKPVLGICLGAQLIAKALGSTVYPNKYKEVGWHPIQSTDAGSKDPLFKNLTATTTVLHWHGDTFDLPTGAVHLAKTDKCANQAFRFGDNVYALQFHLEVTPGMVQSWCKSEDPTFLAAAGEKAEDIIKATSAAYKTLQPMAAKFFSGYLRASFGKLLSV